MADDKKALKEGLLKPVLDKGDEAFMEGLKAILDEHHQEDLQALASWPGELSDPDHPRMISAFEKSVADRNQKLLNELKERFNAKKLSSE
ncbi:MAG: hypothetical protein ABW176_14855 [Candidatus Thiodiazotropha endolucinida]